GQSWLDYADGVVFNENGSVIFKAVDAAGNEAVSEAFVVENIDKVAPDAPVASASTTAPTNQSVTVTAVFSEDTAVKQYSLDGGQSWLDYTNGVVFNENGSVIFKAVDAAGNEAVSEAFAVENIDTIEPYVTNVEIGTPANDGTVMGSLTTSEELAQCLYSWMNGEWQELDGNTFTVIQNGVVKFQMLDLAGNVAVSDEYTVDAFNVLVTAMNSQANADGTAFFNWSEDATALWSQRYDVCLDNESGRLALHELAETGVELLNMPSGEVSIAVKPNQSDVWSVFEEPLVIQGIAQETATAYVGESNGMAELVLATVRGQWESDYHARHVGMGDWTGTGETAMLSGKNRIEDVFAGSDDATILLLSDDANGDALFVDDIYSAYPDAFAAQARLSRIDEIHAGAGDDVVDLTSQRFAYVGEGMTVHGGDGDDVLWANNGENRLFGDAGNDRIVGAGGNDVIVGGAGDDSLHGGGGDDIFVFGGNWGQDTIEQLANGKVTLWFQEGDESKWNAGTLTYTDGDKSVKVSGVADVTLKFGDDGSEQYSNLLASGAFSEFSSQNIFGDKGMLA
ncbi:MAG: hypothetical protein IKS20_01930, partial [Victivallales bacterium]|nr:hypothetical protein [Victivallales bacterium]